MNSSEKSKTSKSFGRGKRSQGWESRLDALINTKRQRAFKWGENDCMHFAADAIKALGIDHDIIAEHRGKYSTARTAAAIVKQKKGGISAWAQELLKDFPQIHTQNAKRGDVCLVAYEGADAMGVCVGHQVAALGSKGLEFIPLSSIKRAWGIGHK